MEPGGSAIVPEVWIQPPVPSGGRSGPRRGGPCRPRRAPGSGGGPQRSRRAGPRWGRGRRRRRWRSGWRRSRRRAHRAAGAPRAGEVEAGVGPHGRAQLTHHRGGAHPAAHHVPDDQRGAARAEGDDVVPVAADRGVRAARLVRGGDPQVVGLLQLLREQRALKGDGRFAVAALAGAQPLGRFGVVGDIGGVHEDAALVPLALVAPYGGAGDGVRASAAGLAGLDRARRAAAQDLVHQRQQAELGEFGHRFRCGGTAGAGAERCRVGVVDVRDAVVGSVHQGDEGGQLAEDVAGGEVLQGGRGGPGGGAVRIAVRRARPGVGLCVLCTGRRYGTAVVPGGSTLRTG